MTLCLIFWMTVIHGSFIAKNIIKNKKSQRSQKEKKKVSAPNPENRQK